MSNTMIRRKQAFLIEVNAEVDLHSVICKISRQIALFLFSAFY